MRRFHFLAAVTALVLSVAVPASALAGCMADSRDSVATQMACCKKAKPDCAAFSKGTMECCKTGTHPVQQIAAKILTISNPVRTIFLAPASTLVPQPLLARESRERVPLFAGTTSPP